MAKQKNKNITPISNLDQLQNEISYQDFEYKSYFSYLCNLIPNQSLEKLEIEIIDKDKIKQDGLVYIFVIDGKIFKIGHTITSIIAKPYQTFTFFSQFKKYEIYTFFVF
jgi:hypothetical protein